MHTRYRILAGTIAGILIGATTSISLNVFAFKQTVQAAPPLDELQQFSEVYSRIKDSYVEEVKDKDLMTNAIRGMLSGLDPHSSYLDAEEFKELQVGTSGEFGGLGIEVGMEDGFVKVISPIDDTPAQKAGLCGSTDEYFSHWKSAAGVRELSDPGGLLAAAGHERLPRRCGVSAPEPASPGHHRFAAALPVCPGHSG